MVNRDNLHAVSFDEQAEFTLNTPTAEVFHLQLRHDIGVDKDQEYIVCFDGSANPERDIWVDVDAGGTPDFGSLTNTPATIALTPTAQQHTFKFTSQSTDASARLRINMGGTELAIMSLDNIGVFKGALCGASADAPDEDKDGIANNADMCAATPKAELVDDSGCSQSQLDADGDGIKNDKDVCDETPSGEPVDAKGCGTITEINYARRAFESQDGIFVVELENTDYPSGWELRHGDFSLGNAYLVWTGSDHFNDPGNGLITIKLNVPEAGTYQIEWRNIIAIGDETTEHNDSWLKVLSPNFYAYSSRNGVEDPIVCPKGKDSSNRCIGGLPNGSGGEGWFKLYRSGGPANLFKWITAASDHDPHFIFAEFDTPGIYDLLVSARSNGHGIDRLVMYRARNAENNADGNVAISLDRTESARVSN